MKEIRSVDCCQNYRWRRRPRNRARDKPRGCLEQPCGWQRFPHSPTSIVGTFIVLHLPFIFRNRSETSDHPHPPSLIQIRRHNKRIVSRTGGVIGSAPGPKLRARPGPAGPGGGSRPAAGARSRPGPGVCSRHRAASWSVPTYPSTPRLLGQARLLGAGRPGWRGI